MTAQANTVLLKKVPATNNCQGCFFKSSGKVKCQKDYSVGYASENCVDPKAVIFVRAS